MSRSLMDRLALNEKRIAGMADGVRQVKAQPDPVGQVLEGGVRPNGLRIEKVAVPLGVIGIIYEARPNVTADAGSTVPESRQRGDSPGRQRGLPLQSGHC